MATGLKMTALAHETCQYAVDFEFVPSPKGGNELLRILCTRKAKKNVETIVDNGSDLYFEKRGYCRQHAHEVLERGG